MARIKAHVPIFTSVFITLLSIVGVGIIFRIHSGAIIDTAVINSLKDNCKAQAVTFSMRLRDQMLVLESDAHFFEQIDMDNFDEVKKTLAAFGKEKIFGTIGVADRNGHSIDCNGIEGDVKYFDFFKKAMSGKTVTCCSEFSDFIYWDALIVASPIMKDGKACGVIYGFFTKDELEAIIEGFSGDSSGASILLSSDGTILARSKNPALITDRIVNFFDLGTSWGENGKENLVSIKKKLENNETSPIPYQTGTKKRIAIMTPIGIHDWYYAIIMHRSAITSIIDSLSYNVIVIEVILCLAFSLLILSVFYLLKSNDSMNKMNEKYRIATKQNQTIVFDLDYLKEKIEFNGDTEFIFGEQVASLQGSGIGRLWRLIHPDDLTLLHPLRNIDSVSMSTMNREFRIRCFDGNYYWFKLIGTFVKDTSGKTTRLVGNGSNVDDVVNKERILKQKAENDALTGLLNKGTFKEKVEKVLENAKDDDLYAFYIIDLDNFKQVNDSMGHIIGDKVLSDTAQKLCVVFSDKDFVGRIGGDEFTAFLKLTTDGKRFGDKIIREKASLICNRLNETYANGNLKVNVSASVGIALYPEHGLKYDDLYVNADSALYLSKNSGRNQYHIFNTVL